MVNSLRPLLRSLIDYAGLFPPTELPPEEAVQKYSGYHWGEHNWILSHFVCPATKLEQITPSRITRREPDEQPWRISVVIRPGQDLTDSLQRLQDDLSTVRACLGAHAGWATIEAMELRVPPAVMAAGPDCLLELAERSAEAMVTTIPGLTVYYEVSFEPGGPDVLAACLGGLQQFNQRWASERYQPARAKLRIADAQTTLSTNQVAFFISACHELGLAWKATAGLHHPFRGIDHDTQKHHHGFINVFAGMALLHARKTDLPTLVQILECEAHEEFEFDDQHLRWRDLRVDPIEITSTRQHGGVSFGSCSFQEPIEELRRLKLL